MADVPRSAITPLTMNMDRKATCLAQADACREKAQADPANSDHWIEEAIKWLERAIAPAGALAMTIEPQEKAAPPTAGNAG